MASPYFLVLSLRLLPCVHRSFKNIDDGGAAWFIFEAALVACGKVINQDGGLSMAHTPLGAAGASQGASIEAFPGDNIVTQPDMLSSCEALVALSAELTHQGMMMKGYPEDVILPREYHASKSKGIANLTLKEASEVITALKAGTMQLIEVLDDKQAKILISECAVVMGACPPVDSVHAAGRRLFANGTSDCKGLACKKPSKAVTKRKDKTSQEVPAPHPSPLSLFNDSGDFDSDSSTHPSNRPRPPAHEFKVVQLPKQWKVVKSKEVISLIPSNAQSGSEDGTTEKADSNYEDKAMSKKWKAKSEDKAPMRTKGEKEKVGKPKIIESSDDEMLGDATKCLCNGPPELKGVKERPKPHPVKPAVKPPVACENTDSTNKNTVSVNTELAAGATPDHAELDDRLPPWSKSPVLPSCMLTDHVVPTAGTPESVAPAPSNNVIPAPALSNDKLSGETVHALVQQRDLATKHYHDANVRQDTIQADDHMYGPCQGSHIELHYHHGFPHYLPPDYQHGYYDQHMHGPLPPHVPPPPHGPLPPCESQPPQPSYGSQPPCSFQPPHGSQPPQQYDENHHHGGGYQDGHYCNHDPREYCEDYWHPSSNPYYAGGGGYYHTYSPDYSDDQTDL
ncbi:hypothetical protein BDR04DRAFT_1117279 [Suillus decipiens]|nr:hypothetical protein BDR04DRAFT_1117279 [Suillus decipiens]